MEFSKLFGFIKILHESLKLLPKNGKLMSFITITLLVLSSGLYILFSFTIRSLINDMVNTLIYFSVPAQYEATTENIKKDLALMLVVDIAFILATFVISFFSSIATILVSSMSYSDNLNFSLKDLILRFRETWKRPLITTLYVAGLAMGYFTFVLLLLAPLFIYPNFITISFIVLIGTASFILYLNLIVVWTLSIVISIIEESCYGVKALGKAAAIAKGKRLEGFMLNLCFSLLVGLIIFLGYRFAINDEVASYTLGYDLLAVNVSCLVKIFGFVAYSVLYFECKKQHGEKIEIHGTVGYKKLPAALLANEMP